jgi:hypothetical protein
MLLKLYWKYLVWDIVTFATVFAVVKGAELLSAFIGMIPSVLIAIPVILIALYFILLARTGCLTEKNKV